MACARRRVLIQSSVAKDLFEQNEKTDLRFRRLSDTKLVILVYWTLFEAHPTSGVSESVPVKAYHCLDCGVSRSCLFSDCTRGAAGSLTKESINEDVH